MRVIKEDFNGAINLEIDKNESHGDINIGVTTFSNTFCNKKI